MPFRTALSGLNAASADLRVTGNNVANTGTTGFKESRAEFADIFALSYSGISNTATGTGARLAAVTQQFSQGNIETTGNNMDLGLSGQGFFVLNDGGSRVYSRAGGFQVNRDGYVVNAQGARLQAYPPQDGNPGVFSSGQLGDLRLSSGESSPRATSEVRASLNLAADAEDQSAVPFDPQDPSSFNFSTSLSLYDSLGQSQTASLFFRNEGSLNWAAHLAIDGTEVGSPVALEFDSAGRLVEPTAPASFGPFTPPSGGAQMDIEFDFSEITQFGGTSNVNSLSQDGYTTGRLTSIDVDDKGIVLARYTNGQAQALGQVAVANFSNPQGLQQLGDNAWAETFAAGEPIMGKAGEGDFGTIQSGGLEASNVDISEQLVNLITAQRNFQANAQVISTADAITQTIINIR